MKTIDDVNFINKKVLVRVDFNVPLEKDSFRITDDTRIRAAVPTINKIAEDGGSVILMSHLGRPKGSFSEAFSMRHLVDHLSALLDKTVKFSNDVVGPETRKMVASLRPGDVLLIENLRFHKEEEGGDKDFARHLAELADVYINDAFGTAHRAHASTAIIAEFFPGNAYFGYLMANEIENIEKVMSAPDRPFTAIIGGAKVSDKILVLENLMQKADNILIGGGMAYTFLKARGHATGNSLCENDKLDVARQVMEKAEKSKVKLYLPVDAIAGDKFAADASVQETGEDIPDNWMGLDIGPKTTDQYSKVIRESGTILWNGPMGVFEFKPFSEGTRAVAHAIAEATEKGAYSLIGGGDSVAAINQFALSNRVSYVSTGGGAMLEYLEGKELPGVAAVRKANAQGN